MIDHKNKEANKLLTQRLYLCGFIIIIFDQKFEMVEMQSVLITIIFNVAVETVILNFAF